MKSPAALAFALLGFGCSSAVNPSPASTDVPIAATSRPSLGSLHTRDRDVLLYASPTGMKVTVKAANGTVLAEGIDLGDLSKIDPHLYDICRSGLANGKAYIDATLDSPLRHDKPRDETSPRALDRRY